MTEQTPPTPTPPANTPTPPTPPATPPTGQGDIDLAKKVGEYEAKIKEYEDFQQKVTPVLETLWSDQELLNKATEAHNKRLGRPSATPPATPPTPPADNPVVTDVRNAQINAIQGSFEDKVGINKLPPDKQKEVRGMVGNLIKEMADPKGNKTIQQVFDEISLTKLPFYLEKAYSIVNRDNEIANIKEQTKSEILSQYEGQTGVIGGAPSSSVDLDTVTLSPTEKATAAKMGVSEEDYLKNKKDILKLR